MHSDILVYRLRFPSFFAQLLMHELQRLKSPSLPPSPSCASARAFSDPVCPQSRCVSHFVDPSNVRTRRSKQWMHTTFPVSLGARWTCMLTPRVVRKSLSPDLSLSRAEPSLSPLARARPTISSGLSPLKSQAEPKPGHLS
jgi:hypothetical protein